MLALAIWVQRDARSDWKPCGKLADLMSAEPVRNCAEVEAVLNAHGRLVARILSDPKAPPVRAFRIIGRDSATGDLRGSHEWHRSAETGQLRAYEPWTSCRWEHAA